MLVRVTVFVSSLTTAALFPPVGSLVAVSVYPSISAPLSVNVTSVPVGTSLIVHTYGLAAVPVPLVALETVNTSLL